MFYLFKIPTLSFVELFYHYDSNFYFTYFYPDHHYLLPSDNFALCFSSSFRKKDRFYLIYIFFLNVGIYHYKLPFSTALLFPINCGMLYFHFNLFKYILKFLFWFHFCLNGCSRVLFNFQTFGNFPLSSCCFISLCFE